MLRERRGSSGRGEATLSRPSGNLATIVTAIVGFVMDDFCTC
jgi:hypothetical protein